MSCNQVLAFKSSQVNITFEEHRRAYDPELVTNGLCLKKWYLHWSVFGLLVCYYSSLEYILSSIKNPSKVVRNGRAGKSNTLDLKGFRAYPEI